MFNRIKKLRRLWRLSNKDENAISDFMKLSDKEIMNLPDENEKAEFISLGSNEEFKDFDNEKKGIKGIFGI